MKKYNFQNREAQSFGKGLKLKKTVIANLDAPEMSNRNGGSGYWCSTGYCNGNKSKGCTNANTCAYHHTCVCV
jgi:hypothetical protein